MDSNSYVRDMPGRFSNDFESMRKEGWAVQNQEIIEMVYGYWKNPNIDGQLPNRIVKVTDGQLPSPIFKVKLDLRNQLKGEDKTVCFKFNYRVDYDFRLYRNGWSEDCSQATRDDIKRPPWEPALNQVANTSPAGTPTN